MRRTIEVNPIAAMFRPRISTVRRDAPKPVRVKRPVDRCPNCKKKLTRKERTGKAHTCK